MEQELENQEGQEQIPEASQEQPIQETSSEKMIPMERFNQVYAWQKELKEFGASPAEIRQKLQTFSEWQKKVEEYNKQQQMTPDEKTEAQRQQQIQKELLKVMPGLQNLEKLSKFEETLAKITEQFTEKEVSVNIEKASSKFREALNGSKIDPKYHGDIEDFLLNKMDENQKNLLKNGDPSEAIKMFNELNKTGMFSGMRAQTLQKPPLRNAPGGTPPKGPAKAKSFDEATNAAWESFSATE